MEKRFQIIDDCINVSIIIPLSPSEQSKLECKDLENRIDAIAKDMHIDWAIEISGNIATVAISQTFGKVVGDKEGHELEILATNFMRAIEHLELQKSPATRDSNEDTNCDIIKKMLDEWDDEDAPIAGFTTMCEILPGIAVPCGKIPRDVAKEMCMCYLKLHNNG